MRTRPRIRSVLLVACAALGAGAAPASAWTTPSPISSSTGDGFLAAAGDPSGEAFAVFEGGTSDDPAMLNERSTATDPATRRPLLGWTGSSPLPGGVQRFTTDGEIIDDATAAAAGEGAGAIVLRFRTPGSARLATLVRDPERFFGDPVTIQGSQFASVSDPSVAIADNAEAVVTFAGQQGRERRVLMAYRPPSGPPFSPARVLARGARAIGARPVTATGPDGWPVLAWVGARSAWATRLDGQGRSYPVQRLAAARPGSPISAAVGKSGDAVVAWIDDEGAIRIVRRMAPSRFSLSLPLRSVAGQSVSGLSTAVDRNGRAFVVWRQTSGLTSRILLSYAGVGATFRTQTLATGPRLGVPTLASRPDGGAAVTWASPKGFQATYAAATGKFSAIANVSVTTVPPDPSNTRGMLFTGPGATLEVMWRQPVDGAEVLVSSLDTGSATAG